MYHFKFILTQFYDIKQSPIQPEMMRNSLFSLTNGLCSAYFGGQLAPNSWSLACGALLVVEFSVKVCSVDVVKGVKSLLTGSSLFSHFVDIAQQA